MSNRTALAADLRVLAFDVFGTVVDWHSSVAREVDTMAFGVDGSTFARAWRAGYAPALRRVASAELPWARLDVLHRQILDQLLEQFGVTTLDEAQKQQLNRVWQRLDPWPDSVAGLQRLRARFTVCTLSNGHLGLLSDMAKHAGLPWDCLLSAEIFRKYKPDPAVYLGAAEIFDVSPRQVLMVAAHHADLAAARSCGLRSAYIERPLEFGQQPSQPSKDVAPHPDNDLHARDLHDLADQLGC